MHPKKCIICGSETREINDPQIKVIHMVCDKCMFIFKDEPFLMKKNDEKTEYNRHENSLENEGYVNIFNDLIDNYIQELNITRKVLEFGSGPTPVFKTLLQRKGYEVFDFDPFYNNNQEYLSNKYQLITSTEVAEHFFDPIKEFKHLVSLLEENGYLVIMTRFRNMDEIEFLNWWYRRDRTHVSFYNIETFNYLKDLLNLRIIKQNNKNIIVFQKI